NGTRYVFPGDDTFYTAVEPYDRHYVFMRLGGVDGCPTTVKEWWASGTGNRPQLISTMFDTSGPSDLLVLPDRVFFTWDDGARDDFAQVWSCDFGGAQCASWRFVDWEEPVFRGALDGLVVLGDGTALVADAARLWRFDSMPL
ncbi:MAG: hypothetical protein H5U40_16480, partial [Polyangiaceae bacterium]|nr:hypothetical protein [Polyangiaceae bacterium]